jgi:peptidoglycan hydrolase CwlO-like protein
MATIGKRILSAFVDVEKAAPAPVTTTETTTTAPATPATEQRFAGYFDKLFSDANIPGPDYYEFARMIGAMQAISDERARYAAAFAGLQVQGLDKEKLLSTANEYLRVLAADGDQFQKTVDTALQEKVLQRSAAAEEKNRRIEALSQEIIQLQQQIGVLQKEIAEAKEKLSVSTNGYAAESERRKQQILADIEKIKHYITTQN